LSAVATSSVGNGPEVYGTDFDIENGIKTAVRWGAIKVTQPSSGLSSVENLPESFFTETPDRDKPLEEPAIAH
jgi:1-phosphofructokinase